MFYNYVFLTSINTLYFSFLLFYVRNCQCSEHYNILPFTLQNQLMSLKLTKLTVWITVFPQALTQTTRLPRLPQDPLTPGLKWGPCRQQLKMQYIILCGVTGMFRIPSFPFPNDYFQQPLKVNLCLNFGTVSAHEWHGRQKGQVSQGTPLGFPRALGSNFTKQNHCLRERWQETNKLRW